MASTTIDITPGDEFAGTTTENCVVVDMGCCSDGSIAALGTSTAPSGCSYSSSQLLGGRNATDNYQTPYTANGVDYDQAYQICFECDYTAEEAPGSVTYPCTADTSKDQCSGGAAGDPHVTKFDGEQYELD
ncbi:MAG: hypothetical protein VX765_01345 [Pseudomonadota bacterium]|nr:hypothetical protein [Pseudomonadota bacterium]